LPVMGLSVHMIWTCDTNTIQTVVEMVWILWC